MSDNEGLRSLCRPEMVVGWYHSHPGFGCWLSGVDINTQQSFEALSERAVAVVVDPIQSVKGKVAAFKHTQRLFSKNWSLSRSVFIFGSPIPLNTHLQMLPLHTHIWQRFFFLFFCVCERALTLPVRV